MTPAAITFSTEFAVRGPKGKVSAVCRTRQFTLVMHSTKDICGTYGSRQA